MRSTIKTVDDARQVLEACLPESELAKLYVAGMQIPQFWEWPASFKKHHVFDGGLAVHTAQVMQGALDLLRTVPGAELDYVKTAVLWHDMGKVHDYERTAKGWGPTRHYHLIKHLTRSVMMAMEKWDELKLSADSVFFMHLMYAHHGRCEWGSPVEPVGAEAWAIHAADMLSAQYIGS